MGEKLFELFCIKDDFARYFGECLIEMFHRNG